MCAFQLRSPLILSPSSFACWVSSTMALPIVLICHFFELQSVELLSTCYSRGKIIHRLPEENNKHCKNDKLINTTNNKTITKPLLTVSCFITTKQQTFTKPLHIVFLYSFQLIMYIRFHFHKYILFSTFGSCVRVFCCPCRSLSSILTEAIWRFYGGSKIEKKSSNISDKS